MLRRLFEKWALVTLEKALACPLERITELESQHDDLVHQWKIVADELDSTYRRVHSELGHITKRQALEAKDEENTAEGRTGRRRIFGM